MDQAQGTGGVRLTSEGCVGTHEVMLVYVAVISSLLSHTAFPAPQPASDLFPGRHILSILLPVGMARSELFALEDNESALA